MYKVCKIRFYPNKSQIALINETLGCCRYMQNMYLSYNKEEYNKSKRFVTGYEFSRILNKLKKNNPNYHWINKYSSKAIKDAILNEEKAFKNFFKKRNGFPKFKSRKRFNKESFFFIKDNIHLTDNKYIIRIPILGKIRITEYNYLPNLMDITSGRVIKDRDKYYAMFIYENYTNNYNSIKSRIRLGIDLGISNYASITSSNGKFRIISHFKDDNKYKNIEKKIVRLQQIISNKAEINYNRKLIHYMETHNGEEPTIETKNIMKGESYCTSNIRTLKRKIHRLYKTLTNIAIDFVNKLVYSIVTRTKPYAITIEDLSISNMLQNEETNSILHKYISKSKFYYFKTHLIDKCLEYGIELRLANKYFASSKICSMCGNKKKELTLKDRIYTCDVCGNTMDRDLNASINLCNLTKKNYIVINA